MRSRFRRFVSLAVTLAAGPAYADALPFLPAGDARLRHEVQLEADEGKIPLATTWPISTFDLPADKRDSLYSEQQPGTSSDAGWFVDGASNPTRLRTFDNTPRESGEAGVQAGWAAGDYAGGVLRLSVVAKPQDDMHYRFDDSYVAWRFGNWWVTAGQQQRWWGPGWDGSLILSNNARPLPQLALERASSAAFETKWLSWIGPWHLTTFMGRFENKRVDFPHPLLWGFRGTMRPLRVLELSVSRTAMWCHPGVCSLNDFGNVLIGKDTSNQPVLPPQRADQLAGFDMRLRSPWASLPLAYYWSWIGADKGSAYKPTKRLRQDGFEYWRRLDNGTSMRLFLEYTDTTCSAGTSQPVYHCAYEADLFKGGWRFRGRSIGDSLDGDGQLYTLGSLYIDRSGRTWELRLRKGRLDYSAANGYVSTTNTVSAVAADLLNVEAKLDGNWKRFTYSVGVGGDRLQPVNRARSFSGRAFLSIIAPWPEH